MTETLPRPRGAEDLSESKDPLLLCAPLRIEARALRRGLRDLPDPPAVVRTGYGTTRAAQQAGRLSHRPFGQLMIMGVGGGLSTDLSPGDLVVGTEVGPEMGTVTCASAPILAGELRRAGLPARTGQRVVRGVGHGADDRHRAPVRRGGQRRGLHVGQQPAVGGQLGSFGPSHQVVDGGDPAGAGGQPGAL